MVALQTVEIPGWADYVKREREVRDGAFLGGMDLVAGELVRPLSLRAVCFLKAARNGLFVPWRFDTDHEFISHCIYVLWQCSPDWRFPHPGRTLLRVMRDDYIARVFAMRVTKRNQHRLAEMTTEIIKWIESAYLDAPKGGEAGGSAYAADPAYIIDLFAAGGLKYTPDEILDMPLARMWQHYRLAAKRVYDQQLANPSDEYAVAYLAELDAKRRKERRNG